jgi:ABC-2 type transport system ATP-binding protein
MWAGAELMQHSMEDDINTVRIKLVGKTSSNELLQAIIPTVEIQSFREIIPNMNDIFISKVNEVMPFSSQGNLTE